MALITCSSDAKLHYLRSQMIQHGLKSLVLPLRGDLIGILLEVRGMH